MKQKQTNQQLIDKNQGKKKNKNNLSHFGRRYMVSTLHNAATLHSPIVAVVGRGHLPGMRQNWNRTNIDVRFF